MNSTNRSRARAGSRARSFFAAVALVVFACAGVRANARADAAPDVWFAGTRLLFETPQERSGALAVSSDDSGLARFLGATGATVAYQPGQKYVIVTAADRRTIAFTLGDAQYTVAGVTQVAPFAPYVAGSTVYLPFLALAKSLYVDAIPDGPTTVLQPQLGSLDVRAGVRTTTVTLRTATPLRYKRLSEPGSERVTLALTGVATALDRERAVSATGALRGVSLSTTGATRNPTTVVTFDAAPGSAHALLTNESRNALTIAFAPAGVALAGAPVPAQGQGVAVAVAAAPASATAPAVVRASPSAAPTDAAGDDATALGAAGRSADVTPAPLVPASAASDAPPAQITGFKTAENGDGVDVSIATMGDLSYEWHRLSDDRWYVDLKPAVLTIPAQDVPLRYAALPQLRLKGFVGPLDHQPTVRVALTLASPRTVAFSHAGDGLAIAVGPTDDPAPDRVGYGRVSGGTIVALAAPAYAASAPAPVASLAPGPVPTWKFPAQASYNSRLIVLDPGHGGSDPGAAHNGLQESRLTLDISKRLRDLLVSRGWIVKMTRTTDVDVFAPNDSGHDELQTRCDIANAAGARLFVSVHVNSFTSGGLNGTTTYFFKPDSYGFAQAIHARLAATLPTKDDGIEKENFYVIHHTKMPAVLVETAFLSNASDARLLKDPEFLQKLALGIADGVGAYASSPSKASASSGADAADGS